MPARTNHTIDAACRHGYGRCGLAPVWNPAVHDGRRVVLFPPNPMGQYFKAANLDKQEVVCPWCIGGGAKLWEWAANPQGAIFTLLLRKSSGGGGGDYYDSLPRPRTVDIGGKDSTEAAQSVMEGLALCVAAEGKAIRPAPDTIVGRWAGDSVMLVGDYDESKLWEELYAYRNISREVVEAWNEFIEIKDLQLSYRPDCTCL